MDATGEYRRTLSKLDSRAQGILAAGINHRSASLELREKLSIAARELPSVLRDVKSIPGIGEVVILSTCNRTELYVTCANPTYALSHLTDFLIHQSKLSPQAIRLSLYKLVGRDALAHLFRVTAGLDSMILGESEVTAQVKQAYQIAKNEGATGPILNRVFQKALHSAKLIRTQTHIAEGQASIGSVVAALAHKLFGERLSACKVLLWGAGKAAEATTRHLAKAGAKQLWIVNRTQTKAKELASLCEGGWFSWEQALRHLCHVDIAIVCTQAPHYVVEAAEFSDALARRRANQAQRLSEPRMPFLIIDLAVPRNIDPSIRTMEGVTLYNIDDLQTTVQGTMSLRGQELAACETIVRRQEDNLLRWWRLYCMNEEEGQHAQGQALVAGRTGW